MVILRDNPKKALYADNISNEVFLFMYAVRPRLTLFHLALFRFCAILFQPGIPRNSSQQYEDSLKLCTRSASFPNNISETVYQ